MQAIEQVVCELKQLAFTGSALPETVLVLIEDAAVAMSLLVTVCSNNLLAMHIRGVGL